MYLTSDLCRTKTHNMFVKIFTFSITKGYKNSVYFEEYLNNSILTERTNWRKRKLLNFRTHPCQPGSQHQCIGHNYMSDAVVVSKTKQDRYRIYLHVGRHFIFIYVTTFYLFACCLTLGLHLLPLLFPIRHQLQILKHKLLDKE